MKNLFLKSIALLIGIVVIASCSKKESSDPPKEPDYPQLIGTWQGTTWQQYPIEISVINVEGVLYLSSYSFAVTRQEGGSFDSANYQMSISTGIVPVLNKQFSFQLLSAASSYTNDSLSGTFDTGEMILTGSIKAQFQSGIVEGNYSAIKKPAN
jgi:hypothetical protein